MGPHHYVPMRRHHEIPIRRREDVPLKRLGDVPLKRCWVFHLRRTCDVTGTYRETSLRHRHDILFTGWVNTVFTDLQYPRNTQHFAFAFETTDLHYLLNFEYSLLRDEGKLIKFKNDEDKIPALNFSIQIVN